MTPIQVDGNERLRETAAGDAQKILDDIRELVCSWSVK